MSGPIGNLVLVVGPSGAGKDTVLAGARVALRRDPGFVFPRREITRPADAGGEDHVAVSEADFDAALQRNGYTLSWQAHGLRYGIPNAIERDLAAGRTVTVNTSRGIIDEARERFPGTQVVHITAPAHVLAERLAGRGRETLSDIQARLDRKAEMSDGEGFWEIDNGGLPETAIDQLISILRVVDARSKIMSETAGARYRGLSSPSVLLD